MLRSLVTSLLYHGKIVTTETRAKEVRKVAEGLIALAVKEKDNFETVTVTALELNSVTLYNALGQEVLISTATGDICHLNLTGLPKGLYLIKANTSLGNSIQKLILK